MRVSIQLDEADLRQYIAEHFDREDGQKVDGVYFSYEKADRPRFKDPGVTATVIFK